SIIAQGPTKSSVRLRSGIQCDLRAVSAAEYPFALNYFTGSKEHNIEMRNRALKRGWTLNEYRLAPVPITKGAPKKKSIIKIPRVRDEAELYRALDLDFIPPELRENRGEFQPAEKRPLPRLIEAANLRGTFHCHTTASDGHNSLEEMAQAAQALGLEYLGIAEHSRSSIQAHGLEQAKLSAQVAAIRKLNQKFNGFRLFAGIECDILRDGSLDFPDEVGGRMDRRDGPAIGRPGQGAAELAHLLPELRRLALQPAHPDQCTERQAPVPAVDALVGRGRQPAGDAAREQRRDDRDVAVRARAQSRLRGGRHDRQGPLEARDEAS